MIYIHARGVYYRRALRHEIGHAFDAQYMTDSTRHDFVRIMDYRFPAAQSRVEPWFVTDASGTSLSEQFAEAYAVAQVHEHLTRRTVHYDFGHEYLPTPGQHRRVLKLLRSVAY